jgi:hypothetical protein
VNEKLTDHKYYYAGGKIKMKVAIFIITAILIVLNPFVADAEIYAPANEIEMIKETIMDFIPLIEDSVARNCKEEVLNKLSGQGVIKLHYIQEYADKFGEYSTAKGIAGMISEKSRWVLPLKKNDFIISLLCFDQGGKLDDMKLHEEDLRNENLVNNIRKFEGKMKLVSITEVPASLNAYSADIQEMTAGFAGEIQNIAYVRWDSLAMDIIYFKSNGVEYGIPYYAGPVAWYGLDAGKVYTIEDMMSAMMTAQKYVSKDSSIEQKHTEVIENMGISGVNVASAAEPAEKPTRSHQWLKDASLILLLAFCITGIYYSLWHRNNLKT